MRIGYRLTAAVLCVLANGLSPALVCAQSNAAAGVLPAATPSLSGSVSPTAGSPQREAALAGLAAIAEHLPASMPAVPKDRIFNVDDYRVLHDATIGDGFEMFLVDPQAVLAGKSVDQSLHGSGVWRFVVMLRGKGVGLITVARMNGKWTMVEAGASELANEVVTVAARYAQRTPHVQLRFIRCQQAVADLIEVSSAPEATQANAPLYAPLASARSAIAESRAGPLTSSSTLSDAELGDTLRRRLQRGLGDPRFGP